jgi:hypothetical protein
MIYIPSSNVSSPCSPLLFHMPLRYRRFLWILSESRLVLPYESKMTHCLRVSRNTPFWNFLSASIIRVRVLSLREYDRCVHQDVRSQLTEFLETMMCTWGYSRLSTDTIVRVTPRFIGRASEWTCWWRILLKLRPDRIKSHSSYRAFFGLLTFNS